MQIAAAKQGLLRAVAHGEESGGGAIDAHDDRRAHRDHS
jgi:hypothetical protein